MQLAITTMIRSSMQKVSGTKMMAAQIDSTNPDPLLVLFLI
jgi:hypothetical protein